MAKLPYNKIMIGTEDPLAIMHTILAHIGEQKIRAKLVNKPFELGILTDKKASRILQIIHSKENEAVLKAIGMTKFTWHDDALRSDLQLAGEQLTFSICSPR